MDPVGWSQGDFRTVYNEHEPAVRAFFARRVGPSAAEELTAQTFLEAWSSRTRYCETSGPAVGWIFGIARNVLRHHYRHEERRARAYQDAALREPTADRGIDEAALADRLDAERAWSEVSSELTRLPDHERDLLMLAGADDLTYREIADELAIPVGTVRSRLNRSRARLRVLGGLVLLVALLLWGYGAARSKPDDGPASVTSHGLVPDAALRDLTERAGQAPDPGPFSGFVHQITEESTPDGRRWRDERWVAADGTGRRKVTPIETPDVEAPNSRASDDTYSSPGDLAVGALTPGQLESLPAGDPQAALKRIALLNDPNADPRDYVDQSVGIAQALSAPGIDPEVRATLFDVLAHLGFESVDVPAGSDLVTLRGPGPDDGEVEIEVDRESTLVTGISHTDPSAGPEASSSITVLVAQITHQPR